MISTGDFLEVNTSEKQGKAVEKLAALWEKKNAKAAQAGGVSLMALSLAACGGSSSTTSSSSDSSSSSTSTDAATNSVGTTGIDTIVGGSGADTLSVSTTTLNAGDSFTGGAGDDLLALFASATGTVGGFVTSGVETISVSNASGGLVTVNMGNVSGETAVRVTGSSDNVTFSSTDTIVPLELSYNSAGNVTVTHNASTVVGTADAMTVKTTDTANGTITLASVETVTIENAGTSTIDALTTTSATTLNVTGSGTLTLTDVDDATTTIDMSGSTGTNTVDGIGAVNATITGGSGNDTIKIDSFTKDDTIVGGDGTDTLELEFATNAALTSSAAGDVSVTGIETLHLRGDAAGDSIDFDAFSAPASFDLVKVTTDLAATSVDLVDIQTTNVELVNTNGTTTAHSVATLDIDLKDSTGTADAVTLKLTNVDVDESHGINTLRVMGVETLDIEADAKTLTGTAGDTTITNFEATSLKTLNVSGDADLTISATLANTVTTVNAASATGDLDVTMGTSNSTVTGGAGNDTFTYGATFNDDDSVDGGEGTDTLEITGTNASLNVEAVSIETLKVTSTGTATDESTFDLDDLTSLTTLNAIFAATPGDLVFNNVAATVATVIVDSGAGSTTADITVDLDKDTSSDSVTVRYDYDGTGFEGDLIANDFETLTLQFNFESAATVSAGDMEAHDDITATDATTIYIDTTNISSYDTTVPVFAVGTVNASAAVTIDLTGLEMNLGTLDASLVDDLSAGDASSIVSAMSFTADLDAEAGITLTAADAVTIVLDDGAGTSAAFDEFIIDLDSGVVNGSSAATGELTDTNVDIIKFVDDGTATNDIGVVVITNFQDRTNYSATSADKIDLSALGVAGMSELSFTAQADSEGISATLIYSVDGSDSDSVGDDFAGYILLTGVTSTHLTAENFVFA